MAKSNRSIPSPPADTTDVSLREYFEAIQAQSQKAVEAALAAQEKAVAAALAAANAATAKAEADALRWRENANEWRGSMNDRESRFVNIDVFREAMKSVESDIAKASEMAKDNQSRARGASEMRVAIFAGIVVVLAILGFIIGLM